MLSFTGKIMFVIVAWALTTIALCLHLQFIHNAARLIFIFFN